MKNSDLKTKLATLATKAELKEEHDKLVKFDMLVTQVIFKVIFLVDGDSQNMFVYQPALDTFELKKDKGTGYIIGWKLKNWLKSKLLPLHGVFLHKIKYFGYKIGIQFNNTPLVL